MKTTIFCLMLAASVLAGCGIKPGQVKSPNGGKDTYPASYPKIPSEELRGPAANTSESAPADRSSGVGGEGNS